MHPALRIFGIIVVFVITSIAWVVLGAFMEARTSDQTDKMRSEVADLWGSPQRQAAPGFNLLYETERQEVKTETVDGQTRQVNKWVTQTNTVPLSPASTNIDVDLALDQRLKGLMWHSLYDVAFDGRWEYVHKHERDGHLRIVFEFPDTQSLYDDFRFEVNGKDLAHELRPENGQMVTTIPIVNGQKVSLRVTYKSRGQDAWTYTPANGVTNLDNFSLDMTTDFENIDFPAYTMSPVERAQTDTGWRLAWDFKRVVTGHGIGMEMPSRIQPGELAASLAFSAPVSLLFFFLLLFVLGTLRGIDIHPINYLFLAGAFFAFHLLFGYTVDRIHIVPAFVLSSIVSVVLVVSYLRLVISARFAFLEAAAAQLIYLVGFSMAHFFDGYTGLTVTVLSILTLFVLMQLTGRIKWSTALRGGQPGCDDAGGGPAQEVTAGEDGRVVVG